MGELSMRAGRYFANFIDAEGCQVKIELKPGIDEAEAMEIMRAMEAEAWAVRRERIFYPGNNRRRFIA